MGSVIRTTKALGRWLGSDCPADCRPGGWIFVQLALLLLPSSALLAGVLLLIAITLQKPLHQPAPLTRPESRWLLALSALMVVGSVWAVRGWVAWVGLFNWLPFFWFYLAIQPYLESGASRKKVGQWILAGTVPVIAVSLLQRALGWDQLQQTLWGLIRWPMGYPITAAGLFDNPNVTAAWLAITMPFLVNACRQHRASWQNQVTAIAITLTSTMVLLINNSRNALASVPVVWLLSSGRRGRLAVVLTTLVYSSLVLMKLHHGIPTLAPLLDTLVPDSLIEKVIKTVNGELQVPLYARRSTIFAAALGYVSATPWVGLGENGFHQVYNQEVIQIYGPHLDQVIQHSHNLLLEFALSHGVPALLILAGLIGRSMARALPLLWTRAQASDRAWLMATLVMVWLHLWDLPSFDSRINILDWLLVAAIAVIARSRSGRMVDPQASPS